MRIVVLMGGDSTEREVSLVTGDGVARALTENGHRVIKIDPTATRDEQTSLNKSDEHWIGIEYPEWDTLPLHRGSLYLKNIMLIKRLKPDIVFNALHGGKGENGVVQAMLDAAELPYTGAGRVASTIAMNKDMSKIYLRKAKLPTAKSHVLHRPDASRKKLKKIEFPQVVKPNDQGSTIGVAVVNNHHEMEKAIMDAFKHSSKVIIEEFIAGREMTVGIIQQRTLPPVEIKPNHGVFDYECKYKKGMTEYKVPAEIKDTLAQTLQSIAIKTHLALECTNYSRVDFRVTEDDEPFILELNTLPGFTGTSLVPMAAKAAGINFNALLEMIIEDALDTLKKE
ncbi:MAG: D-alanine--D-alanine ligase [Caldithrix sp.]|nr:D-alanine--D-alanine ligase [Caldithrix sp.]